MTTIHQVVDRIGKESARHIVPISGGKDSAALAVYMAQHYPQIPTEYVFCDTGCELRETYDFLNQLETILGKKIHFVSAFDVFGIKQKLHKDPLRGETPFDYLLKIRYGNFLPSQQARWCTRELKIRPFEWFIGKDKAYSYIGIRADENRKGYRQKKNPEISTKSNIIPVYPLQDDGKKLQDVLWILEEAGVQMPQYYEWRSRSGCYFCFYQQIGEWQGLKENHPDLFEKAKEYEQAAKERHYTWVKGRPLVQLEGLPRRAAPSIEEIEGCAVCHL